MCLMFYYLNSWLCASYLLFELRQMQLIFTICSLVVLLNPRFRLDKVWHLQTRNCKGNTRQQLKNLI